MTDRVLTCTETVRALWDYVDNACDGPLREAVVAHLAGCTTCTKHVEFAHQLVAQLRTMPVSDADVSALESRVRAALAREAAETS